MLNRIFKYGSAVLRRQAEEIGSETNTQTLSAEMFAMLKKCGGIGLAAPQVGISRRIFVIDTTPMADEGIAPYEQCYVNPQIVSTSDKQSYYTEGCMSIPDIYEDVLRPESVQVRYTTLTGETVHEELDGIRARIFQHEYDHLDGILFIDKLSPLKRKLIAGKLKRLMDR
ncbi:peptide deformylase [Breznakibacter xylanolyticus]|nr:peptide deformylase [Breznakibacter xylanolyticus]